MSSAAYRRYIETGFATVEGWVAPDVLAPLEHLAAASAGIEGGCCEIGVHHGRLFLALLNLVGDARPSLAIDVFDLQALNIDRSGAGSRTRFLENVARFSPHGAAVTAMQADSLALGMADLAQIRQQMGLFRLFSVDGGHTADHAVNDLGIAQELLANGGILLLDDFFQPNWPGVTEGFYRFFATQNRRLAPLCLAGSKLFLTTVSFQRTYLQGLGRALSDRAGGQVKPVRVCGWDCASFRL